MAEHFFANKVGVKPLERINGLSNFFFGDHLFPSGRTFETKRQPIDPFRYKKNVIEAFELTGKDKHIDGWRRLAWALRHDERELRECEYIDNGERKRIPEGNISPSLLTAARAIGYCYVNPDGPYLYICRSEKIRSQAKAAFLNGKLVRGPGNCNDDGWVFFAPVPPTRWKFSDGSWEWIGDGIEDAYLENLRGVLK